MITKKQLKKGHTYILKYIGMNSYHSYDGKGIYTGETMEGNNKGELWFGFTLSNYPKDGICFFALGDIFKE